MSLEQLLISKNKRLQADLTVLKVQLDDVTKQLGGALEREEVAKGAIEEHKKLVTKLEEDLCTVHDTSKQSQATGLASDTEVAVAATAGTGKGDSLLPILTSQRDRYRKRNKELEEQVQQLQQQLQEVKLRVEALTGDNVKLYENIRYLQSYREEQNSVRVTIAPQTDVATRYRSAYEEKVNPFAAFHERVWPTFLFLSFFIVSSLPYPHDSFVKQEKSQRYNNLSVPEKITVNIGRAIISHKYGRIFASCYLLFLHLFVLFMVYRMSLTEECLHNHDVQTATTN